MKNKTNDLSVQAKQNEEGQKNPTLLFEDAFLNKWYRSKEVHVSPYRYHVVFKGHQPGIYDNWPDAQKQIIGFSGSKQKAFNNLTDAAKALIEWFHKEWEESPSNEVAHQNIAEAKKEWYDRAKLFVQKTFAKEGDFQPTVFFLVKEGNRTREYSLAYPSDANNDNGLLVEMIREECTKHTVIAYCCAFATTLLVDNTFTIGKMDGVRLICESNRGRIVSDFKFRDRKIIFEQEKKDHEHSKEKCLDGLCALLYSNNESDKTQS